MPMVTIGNLKILIPFSIIKIIFYITFFRNLLSYCIWSFMQFRTIYLYYI